MLFLFGLMAASLFCDSSTQPLSLTPSLLGWCAGITFTAVISIGVWMEWYLRKTGQYIPGPANRWW